MTSGEKLASDLGAPLSEVDGLRLTPMLCGSEEGGARVLTRTDYLFELKLDGVRIIADKRGSRVSLGYRKLRDATRSYPEIADAVSTLAEERLVLDGEICAFDAEGKPDFQLLSHRIQAPPRSSLRAAVKIPVAYFVFDLLAIGDRDLRPLPIEARRAVLARVVPEVLVR